MMDFFVQGLKPLPLPTVPNGKAASHLWESLQVQERKRPDLREKVGEKGTGRVPNLASVKR